MGQLTISMAIFHGYFGITRGFQAQGAVDGTGSICARSGSGTWLSPWGHHLLMGISWSYHETTIWSRFSRCLNNNIMICGNVTFSPTGWYNQQLDPGDILNQPKTWITGGGYMINMGEIFEDLSIDTLSIVYYRRKFRSQTFD